MKETNNRINAIFGVIVLLFCSVIIKLYDLQVVNKSEYESMAYRQQIDESQVSAPRGNIYDRNLNTLAVSNDVFTVTISPAEIQSDEELKNIAEFLSNLLDVSYEDVIQKGQNKKSFYSIIAKKVSSEKAEKIKEFLIENSYYTINLEKSSSRFYPYGSLASTVLGFTNDDGSGAYGLESYYEKVLSGTASSGYRITNGMLGDMPDGESKEYDAISGESLVLTIDAGVQESLEKNLRIACEEYSVRNGAFGVVMNAKTGEILAMASVPDFNPNQPQKVNDDTLTGTDKQQAQYKQWKNRVVTDTYEPGSVFKLVTGASALESSKSERTEEAQYYCGGYYNVEGHLKACWNTKGHGWLNFDEAIMYSCNPSFMQIGEQMGPEVFQKYFERFGLNDATGIDLPGEASGVFYSDLVEYNEESKEYLASSTFGQSFTVTPIGMITAVAAIVNGGDLVTPYIVSKVLDENGNIVSQTIPEIKRQVISKETSDDMREIMEKVVDSATGTGRKAYIPGYRIGGKTGTSEKLNTITEDETDEQYVVSFLSAFPIDNPEIVTLIALDEPQVGNIQGSVIAAPVTNAFLNEILPYLGYEKHYKENEATEVIIPECEGDIIHEAISACTTKKLNFEIIGDGTVVQYQRPMGGYWLQTDNTIYLYLDDSEHIENDIPDVVGLSPEQAKTKIKANKFNVRVEGEGDMVLNQYPSAGETYEAGIIITIYLG